MIGLARVIKAHERSYDEPMVVKKGDVVRISKSELWNDRHEWLWCTSDVRKEGWMPAPFLDVRGDEGIAKRDYNAIELTVNIGEDVIVFEEASGWYWVRDKHQKYGWIPVECVALDFM